MRLNKREELIFLLGIIIGSVAVFLILNQKITSQKSLTKRILNNSLQSMKASQELANSCSNAYNTAATCVANLKSCNIEEQTKKLDEFNAQRMQADQQIKSANQDIQRIIEEVSANH